MPKRPGKHTHFVWFWWYYTKKNQSACQTEHCALGSLMHWQIFIYINICHAMGEMAGRTARQSADSKSVTWWVLQSHTSELLDLCWRRTDFKVCVEELCTRNLYSCSYHTHGHTVNQVCPSAGQMFTTLWDRTFLFFSFSPSSPNSSSNPLQIYTLLIGGSSSIHVS